MAKIVNILWVNDNPVTAELMVFMYATNALHFKWWDEVQVIVWGATVALLCENPQMQTLVKEFQAQGGHVSACLRCAERLNKVDALKAIGNIEIIYMGEPLTKIIQGDEAFITI